MTKERKIDISRLACTTTIVGKNASADGSVIVSHSDDDVDDERAIYVPARKWDLTNEHEKWRRVYYDNASLGPNTDYNSTEIMRYIGTDRGPGYYPQDHKYPPSKPLGQIPQVAETFAYYDSNYGVMNEHHLMIGECTCGAKIQPDPEPNKRIFYAAELSRVALERCKTAFEAVLLMGKLIQEYGLYGTGETLLVGDNNEGWVMEMCPYDMNGSSGLWVAQRVPDDHFFVAANQFRIRDIKQHSSDIPGSQAGVDYYRSDDEKNVIIYSANLFSVCKQLGWIKPEAKQLDWAATVSYGEYSHPYYSLRRVWRALSLAAPLTHLPTKVENGYTRAYPFSVVPAKKMSVLDVMAIHRDSYEGTEFDLTVGLGAGPFRNPVRYEGNPDQGDSFNLNSYHPEGAWERPLSIYRCGMVWVNQAKKVGNDIIGISWIGLDRPAANCLLPFYCKMPLPKSLQTMNILDFKFRGDSAWWAFNFVANYLNLNYTYMLKDLQAVQKEKETKALTKINEVMSSGDITNLEVFCEAHAVEVISAWWDLATSLIVKYNNGCLTTGPNNVMEKIDYPRQWLKLAGYYEGPIEY